MAKHFCCPTAVWKKLTGHLFSNLFQTLYLCLLGLSGMGFLMVVGKRGLLDLVAVIFSQSHSKQLKQTTTSSFDIKKSFSHSLPLSDIETHYKTQNHFFIGRKTPLKTPSLRSWNVFSVPWVMIRFL